MANIFKNAAKAVGQVVKDKIKLRAMSREDILNIIDVNRNQIRIVARVIDDLSTSDLGVLVNRLGDKHKALDNKKYPNFYSLFVGKLTPKAKKVEQNKPFDSIKFICKRFIAIMDELEKNVDKYIEDEEVTIFKLRLSNVAVLGMLDDAELFGTYSSHLLSYICSVTTGDLNNIAGYKLVILRDEGQKYATMVSQVNEKRGIYTILEDVRDMKKSQQDVKLFVNGEFTLNSFQPKRLTTGLMSSLETGFLGLGIFAALLEKWDQKMHMRMRRIEADRDAMRARLAILKLELQDVDPNSDEYRKAAKVIKRYEQIIIDCDAQIEKYKNS